MALAEEGATEREDWVVIWFPPEGDKQKFHSTEERARRHAAKEGVAEWNPLLEHRITTTLVVAEIVPL